MSFVASKNSIVEGDAINYVCGNQITQIITEKQKERTIYDEFCYVRLGDVYSIRNLGRAEYPVWDEGRFRAERTICNAEIHPTAANHPKFTVVSYRGPGAKEEWEKDFRRFSKVRDAEELQLFGINQSSIPMLIFYNELLPLNNVWCSTTGLGKCYLWSVACKVSGSCNWQSELWIDPKHGKLVRGVPGPSIKIWPGTPLFLVDATSFSMDLLHEDALLSYIARSRPLNRKIDESVLYACKSGFLPSTEAEFSSDQISIFHISTSSVVAVGSVIWDKGWGPLESGLLMGHGLTRLLLVNDRKRSSRISLKTRESQNVVVWLAQALSVFHKLEVSLDDDLSQYMLTFTNYGLPATLDVSEATFNRRRDVPRIYLFVHLGHLETIHFWSHDEHGRRSLSIEDCEYLGLPTKFKLRIRSYHRFRFPAKTYKYIDKWQRLRGYDPRTSDYAEYLGYPVYRITNPELSRFAELSDK